MRSSLEDLDSDQKDDGAIRSSARFHQHLAVLRSPSVERISVLLGDVLLEELGRSAETLCVFNGPIAQHGPYLAFDVALEKDIETRLDESCRERAFALEV